MNDKELLTLSNTEYMQYENRQKAEKQEEIRAIKNKLKRRIIAKVIKSKKIKAAKRLALPYFAIKIKKAAAQPEQKSYYNKTAKSKYL